MTSVLDSGNCLFQVFGIKDTTKDKTIDTICHQWDFFKNEDIQQDWYLLQNNQCSSRRVQDSYWKQAEELCGIESVPAETNLRRIDEFWARV